MSQISLSDYTVMTENPEKIYLIVANSLGEAYLSKSLITLRKLGSKLKAQFEFIEDNANKHPLIYAALSVNGSKPSFYKLKPPITDIRSVKALDFEWEI